MDKPIIKVENLSFVYNDGGDNAKDGDKVTVKYDSLRKALLFCKWDNATQKIGDELFSIAYRSGSTQNEILGTLLSETEDGNYYYRITESGYSFGITDESVASLFIKLS